MKTIARTITILTLAALLPSCASWTQQDTATALDVAQAVCESELLRSETPRKLLDSGVLPDAVPAAIAAICTALPVVDLLAQADQARVPRAHLLESAARQRGLL